MKAAAALAATLAMGSAVAGGDSPIVPADPDNEHLVKISLLEGVELFRQGVRFYDVNALELWADGFIPGAVYFNYSAWKSLLPEDKATPMVFYCANRLCENSEAAARQVIRLGYTHVRQMPDGIYGWRQNGYPTERP